MNDKALEIILDILREPVRTEVVCVLRAACPECHTQITFDVSPNHTGANDRGDVFPVAMIESHIKFYDGECPGCTRVYRIEPRVGGKYVLKQVGVASVAYDVEHLMYETARKIYQADGGDPLSVMREFVTELDRVRKQDEARKTKYNA